MDNRYCGQTGTSSNFNHNPVVAEEVYFHLALLTVTRNKPH